MVESSYLITLRNVIIVPLKFLTALFQRSYEILTDNYFCVRKKKIGENVTNILNCNIPK